MKYFRKLADWFNDDIYFFYFQVLNLYYWYDTERTHEIIMQEFHDKA